MRCPILTYGMSRSGGVRIVRYLRTACYRPTTNSSCVVRMEELSWEERRRVCVAELARAENRFVQFVPRMRVPVPDYAVPSTDTTYGATGVEVVGVARDKWREVAPAMLLRCDPMHSLCNVRGEVRTRAVLAYTRTRRRLATVPDSSYEVSGQSPRTLLYDPRLLGTDARLLRRSSTWPRKPGTALLFAIILCDTQYCSGCDPAQCPVLTLDMLVLQARSPVAVPRKCTAGTGGSRRGYSPYLSSYAFATRCP
eukprot:3353419-Rhodomonas_salina.1